ncbi:BatD family protein [Vibrio sp. SS-MA-C1-2]|uniref:BatD family protein n=1 Tax=Vibrio sp. SS-MA-C1-2 TaxID=2908646 RepID=UPI001F197E30|nr:BatD family protein [Vibrio sp. SS-MA-C1-2]UJF18359.1 BatD family protein [Vibrio sp. SS-MA-C1-2]
MHWLLVAWLTVTVLFCRTASATNIQELSQQGHVTINSWLDSKKNVATTEQVKLYIELGTDRWFSAGTRIRDLELKNAIVLQRNKLATNYTKKINGKTWTMQRWELTIYPQKSGQYQIPPIAVSLQVSTESSGNVRGVLVTQPMTFSAKLPSPFITDETPWVAASKLALTQKWSSNIQDEKLKIGDAIERTVMLKGTDTTAMQFPALSPNCQDHSQNSILSNNSHQTCGTDVSRLYQDPAIIKDGQTRGNYTGQKSVNFTYLIEKSGEITIPAITIQWWDTKNKQLVPLTIAGQTWSIIHTPASFIKAYWLVLTLLLIVVIFLIYLILSLRKRYKNQQLPAWINYRLALKKANYPLARLLLYRKLYQANKQQQLSRYPSGNKDWKNDLKAWNRQQFSAIKDEKDFSKKNTGNNTRTQPSERLYKALWQQIRAAKQRRFAKYTIKKALPDLDSGADDRK